MKELEKVNQDNIEIGAELSAEEYIKEYSKKHEGSEYGIFYNTNTMYRCVESFASMRVEQAKDEWEKEKQALEAKIKHLTQVIN